MKAITLTHLFVTRRFCTSLCFLRFCVVPFTIMLYEYGAVKRGPVAYNRCFDEKRSISYRGRILALPILKSPYTLNEVGIGKLYLIQSRHEKKINSLSELTNQVQIRNEREALIYVRLITSPATNTNFANMYEILSLSENNEFYGHKGLSEYHATQNAECLKVLRWDTAPVALRRKCKQWMEFNGYVLSRNASFPPVETKKIPQGFSIERIVGLCTQRGNTQLFRCKEQVGFNGSYQRSLTIHSRSESFKTRFNFQRTVCVIGGDYLDFNTSMKRLKTLNNSSRKQKRAIH